MHFGTGKTRDVLCRACRTAQRDTLVKTSATHDTCARLDVTQQAEFGLTLSTSIKTA